jgi:GntR family transcriptional regulator
VFDDRSPIYRQIADQIRADVLRGTLAAGEQVMSTTQYAATYRINPATAARAFAELVDEGVLHKRRGIGMFVREDAPERLRAEHRDRFLTEVVDDLVGQAASAGIGVDELVAHIRRRAAQIQEEHA